MDFDLDAIQLTPGFHEPYGGEYDVMEAAAMYSGCGWTDEPDTVNADIARLLRALNDWTYSDGERQKLKQLIPLVTKTGGTYSKNVHEKITALFEWDHANEEFGFTAPENPIQFVEACVDQLTFDGDMSEMFPSTLNVNFGKE